MDNNEEGKQMSRMQDEWLLMNSEVEFMEACFDLLSNPVKGVDESGLLVPDNDFLYRWQRASHFMNVALERRENADVLVGLGDPSAVVAKVLSVFTTLKADQVFKAIGQSLLGAPEGLPVQGGKIAGGLASVWTGGDCAAGGEDLTVTAVAEGRDAAETIHFHLVGVL